MAVNDDERTTMTETAAETVPKAELDEARWLLPVYAHTPVEPVRGEGVMVTTRDGRRLIDFYGGHAVALLGYRHPRLLAALAGQAEELFFQSNAVPLAVRARAAERLVRFGPEGLTRAFLVNSGAEAIENALRIAFRSFSSQEGRTRIVALEGAFHGRTAAAAALTWKSERWYGFPRPPFDVTIVPRHIKALRPALGPDVAALLLEPIQGQAGAVDLGGEYLAAARELTREAGALLIFDEVQCGMGRTGHPFAAQAYGVTPDLLTVAKGLAGGFPAGAVLVSDEAAQGLKHGDLGSTFGGGPLACALIETVIDILETEDLMPRVRRLSALIRETCVVGPVAGVQGAGFLLGLKTTRPAREIVDELLEKGILTGTSGDPNVVRLLPPLVLEEPHVAALAKALSEIRP
jgi:acetylornithine/succinyldiaminopimelate/putrescine aminotransferase